jgi:hypothetical protein
MFRHQLVHRLGLSWRCTYAAVQYTDRLFSKIHLTRRSYQLTAAAAIAVAAKVEEAFDEIPSLSMILMADEVCFVQSCYYAPRFFLIVHQCRNYDRDQLRRAELFLCSQLHWCLRPSSIKHFLECMMRHPSGQIDPLNEYVTFLHVNLFFVTRMQSRSSFCNGHFRCLHC